VAYSLLPGEEKGERKGSSNARKEVVAQKKKSEKNSLSIGGGEKREKKTLHSISEEKGVPMACSERRKKFPFLSVTHGKKKGAASLIANPKKRASFGSNEKVKKESRVLCDSARRG